VLHHFKLQLAHRAQQHVAAHLGLEHLDRTFFAQLGQALLQLLGAQAGLSSTTVMNISGAKKGRPVNCRLTRHR